MKTAEVFKRGGVFGNKIVSSGGFFVETGGDSLVYSENGRRMTITTEAEPKGWAVALDTIARWDDDLNRPITSEERDRIASNIKRALASQGYGASRF